MLKKYGRARGATNDVTIWRIRVACWISKTTCTHAQISNAFFFLVNNNSQTRLSITSYVRCVSCNDFSGLSLNETYVHCT